MKLYSPPGPPKPTILLCSALPGGRRRDGGRFWSAPLSTSCILAAARALAERDGFIVELIPVDGEGFVDLNALENMLNDNVLVVSVMAVNNEVGDHSRHFPYLRHACR